MDQKDSPFGNVEREGQMTLVTLFHSKCGPVLKIRRQVSERLSRFRKSSARNEQKLDLNWVV